MAVIRASKRRKLTRALAAKASKQATNLRRRAPRVGRGSGKRPENFEDGRVYDSAAMKKLEREIAGWAEGDLRQAKQKTPLRKKEFAADSGIPIPDLLSPASRKSETLEQVGLPGQYEIGRTTG